MTEYRAVFDASVRFANGGGMSAERFRLDLPSHQLTEDEIGTLFVRHLGLAMVADVSLSGLEIIEEKHKGSRAVPAAPRDRRPRRWSTSATRSERGRSPTPAFRPPRSPRTSHARRRESCMPAAPSSRSTC